ncbi:hypothetical protein D3C78_1281700 [compost metagenome]
MASGFLNNPGIGIATIGQVAQQGLALVRVVVQGRAVADHQGFVEVGNAAHAAAFDQAQDQVQLKGLGQF